MADVKFTAFVEDVKGDWLLDTAEPHRKQVDGKWVTTSRTYRKVKAAYGTSQDFSTLSKGDRIDVVGKETTEVREYQGKKYFDLIVKAETVTLADKGPIQNSFPIGTSQSDNTFPAVDDDTPF